MKLGRRKAGQPEEDPLEAMQNMLAPAQPDMKTDPGTEGEPPAKITSSPATEVSVETEMVSSAETYLQTEPRTTPQTPPETPALTNADTNTNTGVFIPVDTQEGLAALTGPQVSEEAPVTTTLYTQVPSSPETFGDTPTETYRPVPTNANPPTTTDTNEKTFPHTSPHVEKDAIKDTNAPTVTGIPIAVPGDTIVYLRKQVSANPSPATTEDTEIDTSTYTLDDWANLPSEAVRRRSRKPSTAFSRLNKQWTLWTDKKVLKEFFALIKKQDKQRFKGAQIKEMGDEAFIGILRKYEYLEPIAIKMGVPKDQLHVVVERLYLEALEDIKKKYTR